MKEKFGDYLQKIRSPRASATNFSKSIGISIVYLRDIERGRRPAPKNQVIIKIADALEMSIKERQHFFDLAAEEKEDIPADIWNYLYKNKDAIKCVREQQKNNTINVTEGMNSGEGDTE